MHTCIVFSFTQMSRCISKSASSPGFVPCSCPDLFCTISCFLFPAVSDSEIRASHGRNVTYEAKWTTIRTHKIVTVVAVKHVTTHLIITELATMILIYSCGISSHLLNSCLHRLSNLDIFDGFVHFLVNFVEYSKVVSSRTASL